MAFCPQCGTQVANFPCSNCGHNPEDRDVPAPNDQTPEVESPPSQETPAQDKPTKTIKLVLDPNLASLPPDDIPPASGEEDGADPDGADQGYADQDYADQDYADPEEDLEGEVEDRRTNFSGGMLVLTNRDLTLYSHDGEDIIKSIPLRRIVSCEGKRLAKVKRRAMKMGSIGMLKRKLVVNTGINIEDNYVQYVRNLNEKIENAKFKLDSQPEQYQDKKLRGFLTKRPDQATLANFRARKLKTLTERLKRLQTDPEFVLKTKRKQATIVKQTFTLPPDVANPEEEYDIWVHAITRRIEGTKKLRVATAPPNAVVVIDDAPYAISPCIIDKPLTDESAVRGQYKVQAFLEGYKLETIMVDADPRKDSEAIEFNLERLATPNAVVDERASSMRAKLGQGYVDYDPDDIEMEAVGAMYKILLVEESVLLTNPESGHSFLSIPYENIKEVTLKKNRYKVFSKDVLGLQITYDVDGFPDTKENFELSGEAYSSKHEMAHRYEALHTNLNKKMKWFSE